MSEFDRERFGNDLKKFRNGKSFKTFSKETGVDPLTLIRFENGTKIKNVKAFLSLCKLMGKSPLDFPKAKVKVPEFPLPLSRGQWQALMRLYEFRNHEYTRKSYVGTPITVANLMRLGLLRDVTFKYHRIPYVRITEVGIKYFELNSPLYELRYPDLYGYTLPKATTTQLQPVAALG